MLPLTFGRSVAAAKGSKGNVSSRVGFFASGVATYIHILRIIILIYVNRKLVFYYVVLRINNRQESVCNNLVKDEETCLDVGKSNMSSFCSLTKEQKQVSHVMEVCVVVAI